MPCNQRGIVKNSEFALMHPPNISEPVAIPTALTSLLEPCSSSSLDTTPEINPTDADIAEACEFARTLFGNNLSVLANNAAMGNSSEERNGVGGIDASPTDPGRVSTLPSSRVTETSNATITISDGDHSSEIIAEPDRQSPSSDSRVIEQSHSPPPAPPPSVASASFVSESQPGRDGDYESKAYFASSSSSDYDPDDDTGILRVKLRGRLAAALRRDFPEPSTEAWYAIGQRGAHSTAFISTLGRNTETGGQDNGVNDQSPLAAASGSESVSRAEEPVNDGRREELEHSEGTLSNSLFSQSSDLGAQSGICARPIPSQEGSTPDFDEQQQRVSPQTGGGRSGDAQNENNIPNNTPINNESIEHLLDAYFQSDDDESLLTDDAAGNAIKLNYRSIRRTRLHEVVTRDEAKTCSVVLKKRWYISKGNSLPFGFRSTP
ncbi:hypothetical protein QAD02_013414 [Eretmocerus hayati]|uniref:Uncharacterized protein n=1 Tax=Eretmocerus hayati TaxID=131215 RepID=A0ACC2P2L6_9HYME|nr:hypothetical protein QAD02_013414 [Eretmocerus hayati]